jgi:uncharacterized membrane protein
MEYVMKRKHRNRIIKAAVVSAAAFSAAGCSHHHDLVACYGLATVDKAPYVIIDKGLCEKLAGGKSEPIPANAVIPTINDNDYVMCYGVAAAGKNDCGTKTTACSGSISQAKNPTAWVAVLEGVCKEIGGRVGDIKENQRNLGKGS